MGLKDNEIILLKTQVLTLPTENDNWNNVILMLKYKKTFEHNTKNNYVKYAASRMSKTLIKDFLKQMRKDNPAGPANFKDIEINEDYNIIYKSKPLTRIAFAEYLYKHFQVKNIIPIPFFVHSKEHPEITPEDFQTDFPLKYGILNIKFYNKLDLNRWYYYLEPKKEKPKKVIY